MKSDDATTDADPTFQTMPSSSPPPSSSSSNASSHRYYSFPLLKFAFVLVFLVFFTLLARQLLFLPSPFAWNKADLRTDLSQTLIRPGLNVDNLPLVKIDYGRYKPSSSADPGREDRDDAITLAEIRQQCLTRGYYLGPEATSTNCGEICDVDAASVEFTSVSSWDTTRIVASKQRLRPGGYCMPTKMATCNRNTAIVVYTLAGWMCLPSTDAFAGEGGNRIVVCNGSLRDNALRIVHHEFVPPNLVLNDVYTDRLADGTYRFECPKSDRDEFHNTYVASRLNRLHTMRNWCTSAVPFASNVQLDLAKGRCLCGKNGLVEDKSGRCTACHVHFDPSLKQIAFSQKPCYSFTDTMDAFEDHVRMLRENLGGDPDDETVTILPCGYNNQGTASEYTLPRCLDFYVAAFKPIMPSDKTLRVIDSFNAND